MGRVNDAPEANHAPSMKHFSHPHELELCNLQNPPQGPITNFCSGCKLQSSGIIYICRPCNFILHFTCSQFPQLITHTCHPNHTLTLLPTSSYPGGKFNCDACNRQGDGFSYHCNLCEFDLHVICASKPLKITHQLHPCQLELTFKNPYNNSNGGFSCDVCSKMGSKQWLYRCSTCEFDVHLHCANATTTHRTTTQAQTMMQRPDSFPGANLHNQFQAPLGAAPGVGSVWPNHYTHGASMGAIPQNQQLFQPPVAAGQVYGSVRPTQFMHSASTMPNYQPPASNQLMNSASTGSSIPNYQPPIDNQFKHSASMGSVPNYQPPTVQNYQASRTDSLVNAAMQGLVEGAAQTVGQTLIQGITGDGGGDGGNDGPSLLGSISGDASDAQNY